MKTTAGICSTRTRYRVSRLSRGSLAVQTRKLRQAGTPRKARLQKEESSRRKKLNPPPKVEPWTETRSWRLAAGARARTRKPGRLTLRRGWKKKFANQPSLQRHLPFRASMDYGAGSQLARFGFTAHPTTCAASRVALYSEKPG